MNKTPQNSTTEWLKVFIMHAKTQKCLNSIQVNTTKMIKTSKLTTQKRQ